MHGRSRSRFVSVNVRYFLTMPRHVIIDGNNLLYAMHAHAPIPTVGRETLVKIVERWARGGEDDVTLVFDGPTPRGGLGRQMSSSRITVRFGAPKSADEVIETLVNNAKHPDQVRVVSSDQALRSAARRRRCRETSAVAFVAELFPSQRPKGDAPNPDKTDKPSDGSNQTEDWLEWFGLSDNDFPGGSTDLDGFVS